MSAREEMLARVAAAHRAAPPPDLPYAAIQRDYRTESAANAEELIDLLIDRLLDYKALVRRCAAADLPRTVAAALADRGASRVVVPAGLPNAWLTGLAAHVLPDAVGSAQPVAALDSCDAVVTACAVAVAETGTLILDGSPDQGRRVISLIPDYHLCVVRVDQVVGDVPEALTRLDPIRPLTMISGPSATSDIELNRVEGVHGPRTLEVVIVAAAPGNQR